MLIDLSVSGTLREYAQALRQGALETAHRIALRHIREQYVDANGKWLQVDAQPRVVQKLHLGGHHVYAGLVALKEAGPPPAPIWGIGVGALHERLMRGYQSIRAIRRGRQMIGAYYLMKGERARRSVARVLYKGRYFQGSGFLVGPKLFMTNNHVLANERRAAEYKVQFDYVDAPKGDMPPQMYALDPERLWYTNPDLDFTVVAVKDDQSTGASSVSRSWNELIPGSGKALLRERINIIQHPRGEKQHIAVRENRASAVAGPYIHYTTDTQHGSSGSPVLSDDWNLIALHKGRAPRHKRQFKRKSIRLKDRWWSEARDTPQGLEYPANRGVRISEITHALMRAGEHNGIHGSEPEMHLECFVPPPPVLMMKKYHWVTGLANMVKSWPGSSGEDGA